MWPSMSRLGARRRRPDHADGVAGPVDADLVEAQVLHGGDDQAHRRLLVAGDARRHGQGTGQGEGGRLGSGRGIGQTLALNP